MLPAEIPHLRTSLWSGQAAVESASIAIASCLPLRGSVRRIGEIAVSACPSNDFRGSASMLDVVERTHCPITKLFPVQDRASGRRLRIG